MKMLTERKKKSAYLVKISLTACSLAPMYLLSSSGPLMLMKLSPHSLATTPASSVFPVPGGPYRRSPDLKRNGHLENNAVYYNVQKPLKISNNAKCRNLHAVLG